MIKNTKKWDELHKNLYPIQERYAKEAWKAVIKVFGRNFNEDQATRLAALAYVSKVDLATVFYLCRLDMNTDIRQQKAKKSKKEGL